MREVTAKEEKWNMRRREIDGTLGYNRFAKNCKIFKDLKTSVSRKSISRNGYAGTEWNGRADEQN